MEESEVRHLLSENIKRLRKQRGLSQLKLANELGMAITFINDIENCKKWVSPETLAKLAGFFGVPVAELFSTPAAPRPLDSQLFAQALTSELHRAICAVEQRFNV